MKYYKLTIYQTITLLNSYFRQKFCIDLNNNKIFPIESSDPYNYRRNPFYGEKVYFMMLEDIFDYNNYLHDDKFCNNSINKEYNLSNEDSKRLFDFFNNKNLSEGISGDNSFFSIKETSDGWYSINSIHWAELNNILKEITNLDVLNLENIISQSGYDFKKDGIYHKNTSKKLMLKTLCFFNRDGSWLDHSPRFVIDFDKNTIRGCIDKKLSNKEICLILRLLEKYNVYKWGLNEQWEKTNIHPYQHLGFGGREWNLELIFENDKVLSIGGGNDYPDTYVHLGEEILDIFGIDFLRLDYVRDKELFKEYGDNHLNQH